jgi:hypothetical protein
MNIIRTRFSGPQLCELSLRFSNRANEPDVYRNNLLYVDHNFGGGVVNVAAGIPVHRVRTDFGEVNGFEESSALRIVWTNKDGAVVRAMRDRSSWGLIYFGAQKPAFRGHPMESNFLSHLIAVAEAGCCEGVLVEDEQAVANLAEKVFRLSGLTEFEWVNFDVFLGSMGFGYNPGSGGVVYRMEGRRVRPAFR